MCCSLGKWQQLYCRLPGTREPGPHPVATAWFHLTGSSPCPSGLSSSHHPPCRPCRCCQAATPCASRRLIRYAHALAHSGTDHSCMHCDCMPQACCHCMCSHRSHRWRVNKWHVCMRPCEREAVCMHIQSGSVHRPLALTLTMVCQCRRPGTHQ